MDILTFVVELTGATMLLLYAVRMVRTGIERAFGASFRRYVTTTTSQPTLRRRDEEPNQLQIPHHAGNNKGI